MLQKEIFDFFNQLKLNNNKDWFSVHRKEFEKHSKSVKLFVSELYNELSKTDNLEGTHIYRINNDIRFQKNKPTYKTHFGISFSRSKPQLRGGYYLHLEPENSFIGGGFWSPEPQDLLRIRKEFELDDSTIREIVAEPSFKNFYGEIRGEDGVKTAPKGFDKNHKAIDLIRKRQFVTLHYLSDNEVFAPDFKEKVLHGFLILRPWFDYMSEVLTTNLNGESIIE